MEALIVVIVLFVIACVIGLGRSMKVIQQYEKGVLYRFGRVDSQLLEPGLVFIRPIGDRVEKVNMQIIAMTVPAQEGITATTCRSGWTPWCTSAWLTRSRPRST